MSTFGHFIKEEREKRGWTQTQLGALIGINSTAISRIENESKDISPQKVNILADIFNLDIQLIKDLYYADKFSKTAYRNKCSDKVFTIAKENVKLLKAMDYVQSELNF